MANEALKMKADKSSDDASTRPAPSPKGDKLGVLVLFIVILNTAAAAGMGYLVTKLWSRISVFEEKTKQLESKMIEDKKPPQSPAGKEFIPQEMGVLYPLDSFLVNIASDRGPRFLQLKVELELDAPPLEDEIALKRPALRDAFIVLLTSRNYAELRDPKGMRKLRTDLLHAANNLLKSGQVKEIYFTQFHFN